MIKCKGNCFFTGGLVAIFLTGALYIGGCKSETKPVTYTSNVAPIMSQKCVGCHNPNGPAKNLPLDSYDNVKATVNPGNASDSRLVKAVDGGIMSGKASGNEVDTLKSWVDQGAKK